MKIITIIRRIVTQNIGLSAILLSLLLYFFVQENIKNYNKHEVLKWDAFAYHSYLPAIFIYDGIYSIGYYTYADRVYNPSNKVEPHYGYNKINGTGNYINRYTFGTALFQTPLFIVAYISNGINRQYPNDGFSQPFQRAVSLSSLLFFGLALILLRKFLLAYVPDKIVAMTLLIISMGTNLLYYTTIESGTSHVYLFFIYAAVLRLTQLWYKQARIGYALLLGLCIGWAAITRPTDILVAIFPLLWQADKPTLMLAYWKKNIKQVAVALVAFLIPVFMLLLYWKIGSGKWLYYSYGELGFNFKQPKIWQGLFSFRKGWFVYTPVALLAFAGVYQIFKNKTTRFFGLPLLIYFSVSTYVIFSWFMWFYGGTFGCRPLLQSLSLLALPLSCLLQDLNKKKRTIRFLTAAVFALLICLNLFQTHQYRRGIIHYDRMNAATYWKVFLKTKPNASYHNDLVQDKDFLK